MDLKLKNSKSDGGEDLDPKLFPVKYSEHEQQPPAEHGDAVIVSFQGYCVTEAEYNDPGIISTILMDKKVDFNCEDQLIVLGENDIIPGVELACRFLMPKNESAWLKCHYKYGFGAVGRGSATGTPQNDEYYVPPYSLMIFFVTVRLVIPSSDPKASTQSFQIKIAQSKKKLGNEAYQFEWSNLEQDGGVGRAKALKLYASGADLMIKLIKDIREGENSKQDQEVSFEEETALNTLLDCLNNISAVYFRAKEYGKAKEAAAAALRWDLDNLTALCRAAKAAMLDPAGTFEESEMAIQCAENVDPNSSQVRSLRELFTTKKRQHKLREKELYQKMAKGMKSKTESVPETDHHIPPETDDRISNKEKNSLLYSKFFWQSIIVLVVAYVWLFFASPRNAGELTNS